MFYIITIICALAVFLLIIPLMQAESRQRRNEAIRRIHTALVPLNCNMEPVDICSLSMTIGRRRRRCDICLIDAVRERMTYDANGKPRKSPVSRVHAHLCWDRHDHCFWIRGDDIWHSPKERPKVLVNGCLADGKKGLPVRCDEDVIIISEDEFRFMLVDTSDRYPSQYHSGATRPKGASCAGKRWDAFRSRSRSIAGRKHHPRKLSGPMKLGICLAALALVVMLAIGSVSRLLIMPVAEHSRGERKDDTSTILVCGVDKEGDRTDTMMLVYVSGSEKRIGLLSIPRDTLTETESGSRKKLNAIYAGRKEEGVEDLLNYVQKYIGYRPDGYIVFNWSLVEQITDAMGGLDVTLDHYIRVHTDGVEVYVPEGNQHLNGEEMLATLRYRYGYATADIGRTGVQRKVIKACMEQWVALDKLPMVPEILAMLQEQSLTNLSNENLLWLAKTVLTSRDAFATDTLDGSAEYRNGVSYYVLNPRGIVEQINADYNPYVDAITLEDLDTVE